MAGNLYQASESKPNSVTSGSADTQAIQAGRSNRASKDTKFKFNSADGELLIGGNNNNAYITFGKDRPKSLDSGYGGLGEGPSSTIDIVVGRISAVSNKDGENLYVNNNFTLDAARIYISQMTDIDVNFGLSDGQVGNAKAKSAIALKADGLRFIAREGIKLVTKTDSNNSAGVSVDQHSGIDLIANNDGETLQPMLLGESTVKMLNEFVGEVDKLSNRIEYFIDEQQKFNDAVAIHTHYSPFFGKPTTPSPDLLVKNVGLLFKKLVNVDIGYYFQKVNFGAITNKYLLPYSPESIKSKYNRNN